MLFTLLYSINYRTRKLTDLFTGRKTSVEIKEFQKLLITNYHKDTVLIQNLAMKQVHQDRQTYNCLFYEWELSEHGMDIIQTHQCLQHHLNASLYEAVLEDVTMDNSWGNRFKHRYLLAINFYERNNII